MRLRDIVWEGNGVFVANTGEHEYGVFVNGTTCSVSDSFYSTKGLAVARAEFLSYKIENGLIDRHKLFYSLSYHPIKYKGE